ncbi:angiotensinogen [Bombina bombina]|uniref:angiotensinogen n=1 Tax=Bombina bombina TaxID=8345 RepID=UPI00235AB531|nr:angiotensinogen [Bombina bombina]
MTSQLILLCFAAFIGASVCNRVYVHPFNLYAFNKTQCQKDTEQNKTVNIEDTIVPVYIDLNIKPEDLLESKISLETPPQRPGNSQGLNYLTSLMNHLGFRIFEVLRDVNTEDTVLMSYTNLYSSLVSFYLGTSKNTSSNLQEILGFVDPSGDKNCLSKVDGFKVISALRAIDNLLSEDANIDALKILCMFVAKGVPISQQFVENLIPSADSIYLASIDFKNPLNAADVINEFLEVQSSKKSKYILKDIDASANFLFTSHMYFNGKLKNSFSIPELQDFWIEPDKKISVPMMSVSGMFQYKIDDRANQLVLRIPLGQNNFLLLIQPTNGNTIENIKSSLTWKSYLTLLNRLSTSYITITMPTLEIESAYDIQDMLSRLNLAYLLGKNANFDKISNTDLNVGKIINKVYFKLDDDDSKQVEDLSLDKEALPKEFKLNKPFFLAVFEGTTKALLFAGKVINPVNVN